MKIPTAPPEFSSWFAPFANDSAKFAEALASVSRSTRYYHWDKLRRVPPPAGLTSEQWWAVLKIRRLQSLKVSPLEDTDGDSFKYSVPEAADELLHTLDLDAGGQILVSDEVTNPQVRDRYVISSLMEEAITSSQIEGAATTRIVAKQMLRSGRRPMSRDEQMIFNNYAAMQKIREWRERPLDRDMLLDLHRTLTEGTLDDPDCAGRFRTGGDPPIQVFDNDNQILHSPPDVVDLPRRFALMCRFANGESPSGFLHPVLRAIILHFWLAYDHPFVDGNGRSARALFYWSMLRSNYWLCEFISISHRIRRAQVKYGRAFLYTETDDNDLTYFILYHLDLIRGAIEDLKAELKKKMSQVKEAEQLLRHADGFNHRQIALLSHALRHPDADYTVASHQESNRTVYETARQDLLTLQKRGLLDGKKIGNTFHFYPVPTLEKKMRHLKNDSTT